MKGMTILGIVLLVVGVVGLTFGGVTYNDKDTTEIGPIDITVTEKEHINIPPALAIASLIGGGLLVMVGMRRRAT